MTALSYTYRGAKHDVRIDLAAANAAILAARSTAGPPSGYQVDGTMCRRGLHPRTEENTTWRGGVRRCRACGRDRRQRAKEASA